MFKKKWKNRSFQEHIKLWKRSEFLANERDDYIRNQSQKFDESNLKKSQSYTRQLRYTKIPHEIEQIKKQLKFINEKLRENEFKYYNNWVESIYPKKKEEFEIPGIERSQEFG